MSRIVYINGDFVAEENAKISVFDRGFLFSDGVYEVSSVINGKLCDNEGHLQRLKRSLSELNIDFSLSFSEIIEIQERIIQENSLEEGIVYIQVTRGQADRDFLYSKSLTPNIVMFTQKKKIIDNPFIETGVKVSTVEDIRWARRDIKSTSLLAQVIAKNKVREDDSFEAWLVDENGYVTEGASSNAYIVKGKKIITRNANSEILKGITRTSILDIAFGKYKVEERKFSVEEALQADECFLTSASNFVLGIVEINGHKISDGKVGDVTRKLRESYLTKISG